MTNRQTVSFNLGGTTWKVETTEGISAGVILAEAFFSLSSQAKLDFLDHLAERYLDTDVQPSHIIEVDHGVDVSPNMTERNFCFMFHENAFKKERNTL